MLKQLLNFGWRSPSIKSILGLTKLVRKVKKNTGYYKTTKVTRVLTNLEKRVKHRVGYYSAPAKIYRRGIPVINTVGRTK
jgi:hypothetical protein